MLKISFCAISDSGGIQEEAPSFNTPVLVLRDKTERPEGVEAGLAFLVGAKKERIIAKFEDLKSKKIDFSSNPYGDGFSSERVLKILMKE
jgi:UDP-N-acetylglucosamine 2-epimerase